ncbi:virulence protein [Agarivorans sp. Z349TD_8]|uniref:virulence protein n=1 Tax=Agarivorans sp. Z349TD_8 TaxID=3421434 RepID=UPI003D7F1428
MTKLQWLKASLFIAFYSPFFAEAVVEDNFDSEEKPYFPMGAEQAKQRNQSLPKPYGFSLNYLGMSQSLTSDNISFSGLGALEPLIDIETSDAVQDSETLSFKADLWLSPFLNVYGLLGYTKGSSISDAQINFAGQPLLSPFQIDLEFKGLTYGVGSTLVAGIGNWFSVFDINYSRTDLDILNGEVNTLVISPRLGYRWEVSGHSIQLWGGMMYQNLEQSFHGDISELGIALPPQFPSNTRFDVNQRLKTQWNALLGAQVSLTDRLAALLELGMGQRTSLMLNLGYRF